MKAGGVVADEAPSVDRSGAARAGEGGLPASVQARPTPRYLQQMGALVRKDLLVELRTRERLASMAAFSVLVGILFNYALDPTLVRPSDVGSGLVWMTVIFAGLLGVGRTFELEAPDGAFQGVLMSPVPRDAIFLAKVGSNFVILMVTVLLVLAVFGLFFGLDLGEHPLAVVGVLALGGLGFMALGTLFAALASGTARGETLLPVLVFPLLVPMLIYGASATGRLLAGRPFAEVAGHVRMLGAFTLVALFAGAFLFRHVVEE